MLFGHEYGADYGGLICINCFGEAKTAVQHIIFYWMMVILGGIKALVLLIPHT